MDKVYDKWKSDVIGHIDRFLREEEQELFEKMYNIIKREKIPEKIDRFIDADINFDKDKNMISITIKRGETLPIDINHYDFHKGLKSITKRLWYVIQNLFHNYVDMLNNNDESHNGYKNIISSIRENILFDHLSTDEHLVVIGNGDKLQPAWHYIEYSFETMLTLK